MAGRIAERVRVIEAAPAAEPLQTDREPAPWSEVEMFVIIDGRVAPSRLKSSVVPHGDIPDRR
jgi:hypothetical protein